MPIFSAKLSDGRTVRFESDQDPTDDDILSAVESQAQPQEDIGSQFLFAPDPMSPWQRNFATEPRVPNDRTAGEATSANLAMGGVGLQEGFHGLGEQGWTLAQAVNEPIAEFGPISLTPRGLQLTSVARARAKESRETALEARKAAEKLQPLAEEIGGDPIMRTIGQAIPSVAPALATGPLGAAAPILASGAQAGAATLSEGQTVFEQQPEERRKTWLPNTEFWDAAAPAVLDAGQTAALTAVAGKIFGAGIEGATVPAKRAAISNAVANTVKQSIGEALEEGAQQFVSDYVVARMSYNPEMTFEQALDGAIKAAIAGGVVGAGVTSAVAASQTERPQNAVQPESPQVLQPLSESEVAQEGAEQVPVAQEVEGTSEPRSQEAIKELRLEGVAQEDAQALLSGSKTVEDVVGGNLFRVTPSRVVGEEQGHDEAFTEGYNQAIERLNTILGKYRVTGEALKPQAGERLVELVNPDGTTEVVAFGDKYWDWPGAGKLPSIARWVNGGWSHGAAKPGQTIREIQQPKAGAQQVPARGFLPRISEATGMGEPSLPPTLQDVRAQRAQEAAAQARETTGFTQEELAGEITGESPAASNVAPGAKTTPSRGTFFAGNNPRETAKMMQSRANFFLQDKTDEQAIIDLTRLAGGDPDVQLDNQAANFVIKDLLVRATKKAQSAKNAVDANAAWSQVDRLAELSRRLGAEDARSLVSRNLAYKQIDWLMPVLAWRGIVREQWRKALRIPEGQPLDESVITPQEAKKRNLPELNGEQSKELAELAKEAESSPQGVRRNKVMEKMIQVMQRGMPVSKLDLLRDVWYGSVLMRVGTMLNVLAGSYSTGASFAALAAADRAARLKPLQAMKIIGQFIGGTIEGTLIADQIARKGAYHLLPDAEQRMMNLVSGKGGARFDNLEELLRRGNPLGVLAFTRRFMAALDYIGALGTRDSQVLYGALTRNDQESLDALGKRYDKDTNKRAEQQAKDEMGTEASRAEVLVRKREILEQGVSDELKDAAVQTARRAAQNAEPRGIPGILYNMAAKLPFWVRAPAGLAFMRSAMNMVQNAVDYMPGIGAVSAMRGKMATLPENHPMHRFGLDIPIEERRMMWAAQCASLGIAAIAAAMFLGDDDEKEDGWEISGSWRGLTPARKSQLMEMGERPNSIRFGKNSPWISFKQMPWAPPLAIVGTLRDEERFHAEDWEGEGAASKIVSAWLSGLLYVRDISSLSGVAGMFDGNAWNTQESPAKLNDKVNKLAAQSVGRAGAGYIPSILKEIDEFGDQTLYRPSKEEMAGWWLRNIPYARRTVGPGPALNNFGEPIQLTPPPIKSWAGFGKDTELYNTLGDLTSRGIFMPEPGRTSKIVDDEGVYREMTEDEWYRFIKARGPIFKDAVEANLEILKGGTDEEIKELLQDMSEKASADARLEIWPMSRYRWMRKEQ